MIQNDDFLEQLIIKTLLVDKKFFSIIYDKIDNKYFDESIASSIFKICAEHFKTYKDIPSREIIKNSIDASLSDNVLKYLELTDSVDVDVSKNYDYIIDNTDKWLKKKALQSAILESVNIIGSGDSDKYDKIEELVKDALIKNLKFDMGLDYFNTLTERIKRRFEETDYRIPTYYPEFDEKINGGFPKKTLSVFIAKSFGGKSNFMVNTAARQVLRGHNVVIFSMEMSEDMFAQRFDSIYTGLDINQIYHDQKRNFTESLTKFLKENTSDTRGKLFIKSFPSGQANTNDFRRFMKELELRDIPIHIFYADYIGIMKQIGGNIRDGLYEKGKAITEQIRALTYEFDVPGVSVSQLNRGGSANATNNLDAVDMEDVSESMGVIHTADFAAIFGTMSDMLIYASELHYKIVKNRIGGSVNIGKFYLDAKSLKLYDECELDDWLNAAKISFDSRDLHEVKKSKKRF